ncbi:acyl-CoA carboxylase subunit beta [Piscinibacter koreensis]|jgi:3-methylcrotonyl-CoA carboxylase beta subunit|uniref:Methylcrotonoyl-CoA carboxylase n=1 Tax=Piscinibacter koreensis TaxID=2742824 RepID=A0A7Y6NT92_9BURK|nr:carboxyl transferase domain-containing protein [Schlegelella koreensis]NUZ08767.1 methylcrotonoyl-CoA carboxylase [Schlegelella koreensis]
MTTHAASTRTRDSRVDQRQDAYQGLLATLRARHDEALAGGSEKARKLHLSRGQLLPRERVRALLDPGSPFFEIGQLAGADLYDGVPPGATMITGVGKVCGRWCMLLVNDATVKGGTMFGMTTKRHTRAQLFAWHHRLPCITMVQSGGGFLPDLANIFPDEGQAGSIMYNQVKMSAEGIAQIALVHGPSTAGGAYIPALCDEVVIIRNQGAMFLGSPQLVFAATGEVIDVEPLGGAEMHSRVSGVTDHMAENDEDALAITRRIVDHLGEPPRLRWTRAEPKPPLHDPQELTGLAGVGVIEGAGCHDILARLVDGSQFQEFKQLHGETLVCGFAHIEGYEVGIVAGHGELTAQACAKAAHFVQLCGQRDIPLVFLVDSPGFADSGQAGQATVGRHGAKLLNAVANAEVPKFTVITGRAHGAAYHALGGRALKPNALLMWPGARASAQLDAPDDEAGAMNWARHLWCDAIVEPEQTRAVLAQLLDIAGRLPARPTTYGAFRM